ncbi:MAG: site-specific integrase [Actinomycetota bacterium]
MKRRAPNKTTAHQLLREMQRERDELLNVDGAKRTITEAVEAFLITQRRHTRAAKTVEMEQWRASIVIAGLGKKRLGTLTVFDCDRFLARAADGEFGQRPIRSEALRRIRRLLIKSIDNEIRVGNLGRNVAFHSLMPAVEPKEIEIDEDGDSSSSLRQILSVEEYAALWHAARFPLKVAVDLCGRNGLRPSEARALRWECIDFGGRTITINRQMSSRNKLTGVKTRRALREIPVDDATVEVLEEWRREQAEQRARARRWSDGPRFVISTRYGTPVEARNLGRKLDAGCEAAGVVRIVPYELRHTAITFQRTSGRETWEVADWAGTSERMIDEIYRHRMTKLAPLSSVPIEGVSGPTRARN